MSKKSLAFDQDIDLMWDYSLVHHLVASLMLRRSTDWQDRLMMISTRATTCKLFQSRVSTCLVLIANLSAQTAKPDQLPEQLQLQ